MGARAPVTAPRRESVRFGTIVLAVAQAGRFFLGFLASLLIARAFGTSRETEAFFIARVIPLMFMDWAGGILKVGFIPTHAQVVADEGEDAGRKVAMQFALYGLLLFGGVAILALVLAPAIVRLLAPGFDATSHRLSTGMLRLLAPFMLISGVFLVSEVLLNSRHHFSSPARGRVWGRVATVAAILVLARPLGYLAMPLAFILGIGVQLIALGPTGVRLWRDFRPRLRPILPGTRAVLSVLLPAVIWMMLDQMKFVVDQNFASRLISGQLAALNFAFQIVQVTVAVTASAYLTAMFPRLSELVAMRGPVLAATSRAGRRVMLVTALAVAFVIGSGSSLVGFLLERGAFTADATVDTGGALVFYAPAILFISVNMLLKILLFLRRQVGPILAIGLLELGLNVLLDALLIGPMGVRGLALATSVTTLVVMFGLPPHLARHGLLDPGELGRTALRLLPGTLVAILVVRLIVGAVAGDSWLSLGVALGLAGIGGSSVFGAGAWLLGVPEVRDLSRKLGGRR